MNILIIDDDAIIRKWLSLMLNQIVKYDISIFEASDGEEAFNLCAEQAIDLAITDIKMPRLNGIEFMEKLRLTKPTIRTVVLSSYDDFTLVRKALKSGAIDYIRKAEMTIEDITLILDKVNNDIELERALKSQDERTLYDVMTRKKAFCDYIEHGRPAIFDFLAPEAPHLSDANVCVALFTAQDASGKYLPMASIVNICNSIIQNAGREGLCVPWKDDIFVLNYKCPSVVREYQEEEFLKIFETINSSLKRYYAISIPFSINMLCYQGTSYIDTFHAVLAEYENRLYYGATRAAGQPGQSSQAAQPGQTGQAGQMPAGAPNPKSLINTVTASLASQKYKDAFSALRNTVQLLHEQRVSPLQVRETCYLAFHIFYAHTAMFNAQDTDENSLYALVQQLNEVASEQGMANWLDAFEKRYMAYINMVYNNFSPVIKSAIQYINANYYKKLTLDEVANEVYRNRTYFSQLFKKEVGVNFHDYLEDVRIKNAIVLINSGEKPLSEIPEYVGFANQTYFSKVFKQCTGMSPAKYQKRVYKNACG